VQRMADVPAQSVPVTSPARPCRLSIRRSTAEQRSFGIISAICLLTSTSIWGQTALPARFEVASVKPGGDIFSTKPQRAGGRIRWTTQLCYLIGYAYRLDFSRVTGQKCGSVYSLEAKFDPAATDDEVRLMIQSLLTDRFKMRAHRVTKEANGVALTIAKGGLKIREANMADEPPPLPAVKGASSGLRAESYISATWDEPGVISITGRRVSMSQLAETLQRAIDMPVWDRTGLPGNYYFAFRFAQGLSADLKTDAPSLGIALQHNIGLKLERRKGPVQVLFIDDITEPTPN
jgi:uncharacterized protein (TIGR03435 family)